MYVIRPRASPAAQRRISLLLPRAPYTSATINCGVAWWLNKQVSKKDLYTMYIKLTIKANMFHTQVMAIAHDPS